MVMLLKTSLPILILAVYIIITTATTLTVKADDYLCETIDCVNGMFNQAACTCECIAPFCADVYGNCIVSGTCDNPWEACEKGVNCPWWKHTSNAESCETGPLVPAGTWDIYTTEEICCTSNFPYSTFCGAMPETSSPSKYPTIALIEDDEEIIPIQFSVSGITNTVSIDDINDEMEIALKRILLRVAENIDGLKIIKVEAIVSPLSKLRRVLEEEQLILYFHVYVVRSDEKNFGPYIIQGIRDSYEEVFSEIQTYSDTKQLSGNLEINFCTLSDGIYSLCVIDEEGVDEEGDVGTRVPMTLQSKENGLAGWAIALIVILVLSLVCCGGYAIAVVCFGVANCFQDHDNNKGKDIQNNIYMDERRGPVDYERRLAIMDGRSGDNESRAAISYEQRQTPQASAVRDDLLEDLSFHGSFKSYKRKTSRDPTMYIPGQEGRPDPIDFHGSNDRSGRMYSEEPPLKPKREPTMYVDGKVEDQRINNVVYENDYSDDDGVYNDYERNASNSMTSRQYYGRSSGNHQHRDSAGGRSAFSSHHSRSSSTANRSTVYSG